MKSVKLLQDARIALDILASSEQSGVESELVKRTMDEIDQFTKDQKEMAESGKTSIQVSTDGQHWEYANSVEVVGNIIRENKTEVKSMTMMIQDEAFCIDFTTNINSQSLDNKVLVNVQELNNTKITHF